MPILILSITLGFSQTDPSYPQPNDADDTYFDDDTPEAVASVSYEPFYDDLSPHGTWTTYDDYGYVWIPRAEAGFQPYSTNGHWVMTDYGWTWASDYSWGWAAFHYGRWTYAPRYGWMWIPGRTWGPAWVSWRQSNDYYGWAPLGPRRRGVNVAVVIPVEHYRFVPVRYMANPQLRNYVVNRQQNGVIINNTTVINTTRIVNKTRIVAGPPREQFERTTGQKVDVVVLKENNHARAAVVNNGQMEVYRPQMSPLRNNAAPPQPLKVEAIKDVPQRVTKRQPPTMQPISRRDCTPKP